MTIAEKVDRFYKIFRELNKTLSTAYQEDSYFHYLMDSIHSISWDRHLEELETLEIGYENQLKIWLADRFEHRSILLNWIRDFEKDVAFESTKSLEKCHGDYMKRKSEKDESLKYFGDDLNDFFELWSIIKNEEDYYLNSLREVYYNTCFEHKTSDLKDAITNRLPFHFDLDQIEININKLIELRCFDDAKFLAGHISRSWKYEYEISKGVLNGTIDRLAKKFQKTKTKHETVKDWYEDELIKLFNPILDIEPRSKGIMSIKEEKEELFKPQYSEAQIRKQSNELLKYFKDATEDDLVNIIFKGSSSKRITWDKSRILHAYFIDKIFGMYSRWDFAIKFFNDSNGVQIKNLRRDWNAAKNDKKRITAGLQELNTLFKNMDSSK